jgi:hypothetical protein
MAALMVGMLLVMWAETPSGCEWPGEAPRQLVLTRSLDREHLARDLASATRIARRYAASTPDNGNRGGRASECEAALIGQIRSSHGL